MQQMFWCIKLDHKEKKAGILQRGSACMKNRPVCSALGGYFYPEQAMYIPNVTDEVAQPFAIQFPLLFPLLKLGQGARLTTRCWTWTRHVARQARLPRGVGSVDNGAIDERQVGTVRAIPHQRGEGAWADLGEGGSLPRA